MTTSNYIAYSQAYRPTQRKTRGRGNKIVVGTVVKSKIGELEKEEREGISRRLSTDPSHEPSLEPSQEPSKETSQEPSEKTYSEPSLDLSQYPSQEPSQEPSKDPTS